MKFLPLAAGALALCSIGVAHAQPAIPPDDAAFATKAAAAGVAEVAEAKIAVAKTHNAAVKDFAQRIITDHTKANNALSQIAEGKALSLPMEPIKQDQVKEAQLKTLSGPAFDKRYMADQLAAHQQAVALFKSETEQGKDAALKQFASQTLPILEHHLQMAESLANGKQPKAKEPHDHPPQ